mmetsp:Transcript_54391/g.115521  ORF Transcript_54391/g.115521 Transcript_54391/m.115521 type:complete len:249 (+) Transcript_54391:2442-3188(+)
MLWTRLCFSSSVRRFTWVGCAVRTSSTVWLVRLWKSSFFDTFFSLPSPSPLRNWRSTPAVESRFVSCSAPSSPSDPSLVRSILSLRHLWWASAALATPRKWANAREMTPSSFADRFDAKSAMGPSREAEESHSLRLFFAMFLIFSTISRTSSPWCNRMASPRRVPIVRTSERSMRSSYARFLSSPPPARADSSIWMAGKRVGSLREESHALCGCRKESPAVAAAPVRLPPFANADGRSDDRMRDGDAW